MAFETPKIINVVWFEAPDLPSVKNKMQNRKQKALNNSALCKKTGTSLKAMPWFERRCRCSENNFENAKNPNGSIHLAIFYQVNIFTEKGKRMYRQNRNLGYEPPNYIFMEHSIDDYQDNINPTEDFDRRDEFLGEDIYTDLEDKWYDIADEYRNRYTHLTDQDVNYEPGHFKDMLDRIGTRRGKSRLEIRGEIENW